MGGEHDELVLSDLFSFLHCLPSLGEKGIAISRIKGGGIFLAQRYPVYVSDVNINMCVSTVIRYNMVRIRYFKHRKKKDDSKMAKECNE